MLDCTIGTGGHTTKLLDRFENLHVCGLDLDQHLIEKLRVKETKYGQRLDIKHLNFGEVDKIDNYKNTERKKYDIVFADLGWNIEQLTDRGLSYSRGNEELDMRYDMSNNMNIKASDL